MKKILIYAAMFAALSTSFIACEKNSGDNGKDNGKTPEEPSFVSPITVDGDFSDWDALDASKVSVCETVAGSKFSALTKAKAYADEMYINVYIECDVAQINKENAPVHIYFNTDNSDATGGYGDEFSDPNTDWMLENAIFEGGEEVSFNPALFKWWGEVGGSGWLWTDPDITPGSDNGWGAVLPNGSGIASGKGDGNGKYEIQIIREMMMGATFADTFTIGFDIQADWSSVGILPNAAMTETNPNGLAPKMSVTIDK